jgi:DNA-binding NarL/FixJ family response regulator
MKDNAVMMANRNTGTPEELTGIENRQVIERLTTRETEVLRLVADGCTTKEIASRLGISFKTAACHRYRIMSKLDVHNGALLVRRAIGEGLIQL